MSDNAKYLQAQAFTLAGAGCIMGATSITLSSMLQIDAVTPVTMADFGSKGFGTIEPGSGTSEEQISFTGITQNANGTATLTGVSSVLFASPYTETSGTAFSHPGGVTFVISNTSGFYNRFANKNDDETVTGAWIFPNDASTPTIGLSYAAPTTDLQVATKKYVDDTTTAGAPDASDTVLGITKLSIAAVSPTNPIAVGDNDTRVPTVNTSSLTTGELQALAGTTGTPSSSNKYVTQADQTGVGLPAGVVLMYGVATAPTGFLLCDGSSQLRASFANLFTAIGTTYGSADGTHFNVPDFRGRAPVGTGTGTGGGASGTGLPTGGAALTARALAGWNGEETHTLTTPEIPAHTHTVNFTLNGGSGGHVIGTAGATDDQVTGSTGGGGSHNNIQPTMGISFIIKT